MAIGCAVERGSLVYVYDEKGRQLYSKPGKLHGYTATTVSIQRANTIYTFDERGRQLYSKHA